MTRGHDRRRLVDVQRDARFRRIAGLVGRRSGDDLIGAFARNDDRRRTDGDARSRVRTSKGDGHSRVVPTVRVRGRVGRGGDRRRRGVQRRRAQDFHGERRAGLASEIDGALDERHEVRVAVPIVASLVFAFVRVFVVPVLIALLILLLVFALTALEILGVQHGSAVERDHRTRHAAVHHAQRVSIEWSRDRERSGHRHGIAGCALERLRAEDDDSTKTTMMRDLFRDRRNPKDLT